MGLLHCSPKCLKVPRSHFKCHYKYHIVDLIRRCYSTVRFFWISLHSSILIQASITCSAPARLQTQNKSITLIPVSRAAEWPQSRVSALHTQPINIHLSSCCCLLFVVPPLCVCVSCVCVSVFADYIYRAIKPADKLWISCRTAARSNRGFRSQSWAELQIKSGITWLPNLSLL